MKLNKKLITKNHPLINKPKLFDLVVQGKWAWKYKILISNYESLLLVKADKSFTAIFDSIRVLSCSFVEIIDISTLQFPSGSVYLPRTSGKVSSQSPLAVIGNWDIIVSSQYFLKYVELIT